MVEDKDAGWFAPLVDKARLERARVKVVGGGAHQSKTMMLADLSVLLESDHWCAPANAIVEHNVLGKPSNRARQVALYRLRQLYGLDDNGPVSRTLVALWKREQAGRPLLALISALSSDPSLRDGADAVLDAPPGTQVRWPAIAAAFEARHPGRLGEKMAKSLAQNAASTWTQSGHLVGAVRKIRARAQPTPITAAFAALLATICGFGGPALLESRWLDILDRPIEDRLSLLRQAEGLGLVRLRAAGDVLEIDVRQSLAATLEIPELVDA